MNDLSGLPFRMLAFDKDGRCHGANDPLHPAGTTDLLVLSHGWKNDEADALKLYTGFIKGMLDAGGALPQGRHFAVVGVSWPSFKFRSDLTLLPDDFVDEDMGGAADAGGGDVDLSQTELENYAAEIAAALGVADPEAFVEKAKAAASATAAPMVGELRKVTLSAAGQADGLEEHDALFAESADELVRQQEAPPPLPQASIGDSEGDAADLGDAIGGTFKRWLTGGRAGVARVLNQFTYYEMKARAGTVGKSLAAILAARVAQGVRIHMVGHSFGARLVTAATHALSSRKAASLTLLQGAFSHNAFSPANPTGAFRAVVAPGKVAGPIIVTHTHNDTAVGFFYAVASLASGTVASGIVSKVIGGPGDSHGGIGANGARRLPAEEVVQITGALNVVPDVTVGVVTNVLADGFIRDHNDVGAARAGPIIRAAVG